MTMHQDSAIGFAGAFSRRDALTTLGAVAAAAAASGVSFAQGAAGGVSGSGGGLSLGWDAAKGQYTLPELPYAPDALEPHIDAETMKIHHSKHHAAYVAGANKALAELAKIRSGEGDAALIKHWSRELSFHSGGHINHTIFWLTMAPAGQGGGGKPEGALASAIDRDFGSFDGFSKHFQAAAGAVEGSGWAWLAHEPMSGRLVVLQMEKQQDLAMVGVRPLLGVDVWEHAYYLRYQNRRGDYVKAFMNVINWGMVGRLFGA
jgi:Fe-Mn family superoxide dismutase